ncbi:MAG: hypothetical protein HGA86_02565 [Anaerolineaceae bacterium]|nr:hypothetical protein [Anaerolineaceae bacterium]
MIDFTDISLSNIRRTKLHGIDLPDQMILPAYHGYSINNLPASIFKWLGKSNAHWQALADIYHQPLTGPFRKVVMLLVDGLSLRMFQNFINGGSESTGLPDTLHPLLDKASLFALTSVFPSTTTTALTSLWTGATPLQHSILGYELFLKEFGMTTNMITHTPTAFTGEDASLRKAGFQADAFLKVPVIGPLLASQGIKTYTYMPESIIQSGLTTMFTQGVERIPYRTDADLWVTLDQQLARTSEEQAYIHVYWGNLDELQHKVGPSDPRVLLEWAAFAQRLAWFMKRQQNSGKGDTLFLMTADHGQIDCPPERILNILTQPELLNCLTMLPTGESRAPYFFIRPGKEEDFLRITREFAPDVKLVSRTKILHSSIYGSGEPCQQTLDRTGDWVGIMPSDRYFYWSTKENKMLGRHGGLHYDEMVVPLLGMVF